MNEHYHCFWCGHVIATDCGYSVVASSTEPDRHFCHGANHDCYDAAYKANEAKTFGDNIRRLAGV